MKSADQRWEDFYSRLKDVPKDNTGHQVFKEAMRPQNYKYQVEVILKHFPDLAEMNILEIGCGFGGLCMAIHKVVTPNRYAVIDNPEMLAFAGENLAYLKRVSYIRAPQADMISWPERQYDLLISNYCISETPREYQDFVLSKILPRCKNVFMLDGDKKSDYPDRLNRSLYRNFARISIYEYKLDWRVELFVAKENINPDFSNKTA